MTLALTMTTVLTGCGVPIGLDTALENNSGIVAFSYDINLEMNVSNNGQEEDTVFTLSMDGAASSPEDRVKTQADVSATLNGEALKFPIYLDTSTKEFHFEIFAGIPDLMKETFAGKTDFYVSSEQLQKFLQLGLTADEYKKFEEEIQRFFESGTETSALSIAIASTIQSHVDGNSDRIRRFDSIEGKKTSENGTYTFTFSKTDIQAMVTEFLSNKDYYQLLKDEYASIATYDQVTLEEMPDAETMIKEFNDAFDILKSFDLTFAFTIEDSYITGVDFNFISMDEEEGQVDASFSLRLSDINKPTKIETPDKNADTTLDLVDYFQSITQTP